jgi:predicted NBD/HSP70 family sugar kinase
MEGQAGVGPDALRRSNLSTVLRLLHVDGGATRSELTARTGLNRSTIAALVRELSEHDLAVEGDAVATGAPGRPSPTVAIRTDRVAVLAIDVKVDSLAVAAFGLGGTRLAGRRVQREDRDASVDATLDVVEDLAGDVLAALPNRQRLVGIGVAVAGLVRTPSGIVDVGPNLGWSQVPLAELLRRRLRRRVPVVVGNEADTGVLAECVHGAGRGVDHLLYLSGEVGVGGGIIASGSPLAGSMGYAGEVGHMTVEADGPRCRCGNSGCWELRVGERALLRGAGRAEDGGQAMVLEVLAAAAAGEGDARRSLDELGRWMGIGLASLVNLFDPQRIVLGGLHAQIHPMIVDTATRELRARSLVAARTGVAILRSDLGIDASLVGAGEAALQPLLSDPTTAASRSSRPVRTVRPLVPLETTR